MAVVAFPLKAPINVVVVRAFALLLKVKPVFNLGGLESDSASSTNKRYDVVSIEVPVLIFVAVIALSAFTACDDEVAVVAFPTICVPPDNVREPDIVMS